MQYVLGADGLGRFTTSSFTETAESWLANVTGRAKQLRLHTSNSHAEPSAPSDG